MIPIRIALIYMCINFIGTSLPTVNIRFDYWCNYNGSRALFRAYDIIIVFVLAPILFSQAQKFHPSLPAGFRQTSVAYSRTIAPRREIFVDVKFRLFISLVVVFNLTSVAGFRIRFRYECRKRPTYKTSLQLMISRTVGVVKPNDRTMTDNSYYTRLTYEYKVSTLLFHRQAWRCDLVHQKVPPPRKLKFILLRFISIILTF